MAFNILPIELNREIATYLESDKDLASFIATCQATRNAVEGDNKSFWRHRFLQHYEPMESYVARRGLNKELTHERRGEENARFQEEYKKRAEAFRNVRFVVGRSRSEAPALKIIKNVLVDAFNGKRKFDEYGRPTSSNIEFLNDIINKTNILDDFMLGSKKGQVSHPLFDAIQICMASWTLDHNRSFRTFNFEHTQRMVYERASLAPLFKGPNNDVNLGLVKCILNFFRMHMASGDTKEWSMQRALRDLGVTDMPQHSTRKLSNEPYQLGRHWRGTYSYLEPSEMMKMRRNAHGRNQTPQEYTDCHITDDTAKGPIQTLTLDFPFNATPDESVYWPSEFSNIIPTPGIPAIPPPANHPLFPVYHPAAPQAPSNSQMPTPPASPGKSSSTAKKLEFEPNWFIGEGIDDESYHSTGFTHPLQSQQHIPGWQRLSMMKYYVTEHGTTDFDALWAYEGVVLPGGKIILGRWWAVDRSIAQPNAGLQPVGLPEYSGPFILWEVEGPKHQGLGKRRRDSLF